MAASFVTKKNNERDKKSITYALTIHATEIAAGSISCFDGVHKTSLGKTIQLVTYENTIRQQYSQGAL